MLHIARDGSPHAFRREQARSAPKAGLAGEQVLGTLAQEDAAARPSCDESRVPCYVPWSSGRTMSSGRTLTVGGPKMTAPGKGHQSSSPRHTGAGVMRSIIIW